MRGRFWLAIPSLTNVWNMRAGVAYLKIGHLGNAPYSGIPGDGFYPLEHLYPVDIGRGEE